MPRCIAPPAGSEGQRRLTAKNAKAAKEQKWGFVLMNTWADSRRFSLLGVLGVLGGSISSLDLNPPPGNDVSGFSPAV
jgi:hypothetical protein